MPCFQHIPAYEFSIRQVELYDVPRKTRVIDIVSKHDGGRLDHPHAVLIQAHLALFLVPAGGEEVLVALATNIRAANTTQA